MADTPTYATVRLNSTSHLVIHNDTYFEYPYIYVKPSDLKTFIETEILREDAASGPSEYRLMAVCTHCHFDHIGGIESYFDDGAMICTSGHDPDFNGSQNRTANSPAAFRMPTPQYQITHLLEDGEEVRFEGVSLGLKEDRVFFQSCPGQIGVM
ncbi:hypothetical protein B0A55_06771 [Friedmanniomyces simplex]|uniref:Metallo-beta-lactamase domain-containing protein n=1 Tax=Friedmanniomyces simplex TaxID=329884 RepID=A0A4U0X3R6_9PEZI|nr:hypothetical protein B0A55_06771 [Friedmanniomyces simplex]